ncbi:hypothetical protein JX266_014234 [Neoarthrinium moseri]|nr:hypothetical protein JX266_014234 [Neoarthrinium moseri]
MVLVTTALAAAAPPVIAPAAPVIVDLLMAGTGATTAAVGEGALVGLGVIGSGGSGSAGIALATAAGPVGWIIVGCDKTDNQNGDSDYTWDCWKPVVRDTSPRPSCGMSLRCLAAHPNVRSISLDQGLLLVRNTFGEHFRLSPVTVKGMLAFHASIFST